MNEKRSKTTVHGGAGFVALLQIAFIVLKLLRVIDWSWLWVLAPFWMSAAFIALVILIALIILMCKFKI